MTEQVLGGFVLHEVVGWGAVGQVYRATDPRGGQVAVKVLRPELAHDREVVQRFLRERSILAGIEAAGEHGAIRSLLSGRRAAYVGGVAVATAAAGAAGALVLVSRASRRRMNLAG